jgi:hypothetical protein
MRLVKVNPDALYILRCQVQTEFQVWTNIFGIKFVDKFIATDDCG